MTILAMIGEQFEQLGYLVNLSNPEILLVQAKGPDANWLAIEIYGSKVQVITTKWTTNPGIAVNLADPNSLTQLERAVAHYFSVYSERGGGRIV